jgi:hypothetical protein
VRKPENRKPRGRKALDGPILRGGDVDDRPIVRPVGLPGKSEDERFRDPLVRLSDFLDEIEVHCPRCSGRASVLPAPQGPGAPRSQWTRRSVSCLLCGYSAYLPKPEDDQVVIRLGGCGDSFSGLPLWLAAECRGRVLWAYNTAHLDFLEAFVSAQLRERGPILGSMSLVERLPAWIKDAKNRDDVIRAIHRLRAKAA